ncbi:TVP38/TMEM64 family protein [Sutcliffiella horikoshii]|uniref:TVP38/TMEM64 family protein n=1 Tax=Sutcliffiella horikoshii TaxID=79883 RepID=UPI001CFEAB6E|nr:VTT domain-containing protein [Sutcliffiella horikoshii]
MIKLLLKKGQLLYFTAVFLSLQSYIHLILWYITNKNNSTYTRYHQRKDGVVCVDIMETGKKPIMGIGLILIVLLVYYISKFMVMAEYKELENLLLEYGSMAKFLFFLLCLAQPIILPLPEAVTIPAGSLAFGASTSFYLGFSGTLTGIIVMFFIARYGGIKVASKLVKERHLKKYQDYVRKNETIILALLFIIPVLPDEIICVGAGIGAVSFKKFLIIASLSKFVTTFVLAYSVSLAKLLDLTSTHLLLSCSVIMGIVFLTSFAFNKYWNRKRMEM